MVKSKDKFWEHAIDLKGRFKCKYCLKEYSGGITRIKNHLSRLTGRDIAACEKVPEEVQAMAVLAVGPNKKPRSATYSNANEVEGHISSSSAGSAHVTVTTQTTIQEIFNKKDKEAVDNLVGKAFIMNNIPFNIIQTPSFIQMCKAISDFGVGYYLPSYSTLRRKLVPIARNNATQYVLDAQKSWDLTGCTIMSDIWTDMKERSYINIVAYSPSGAVFLNSFERSADRKTGLYLRDIIISVMEEIGPEKVVQIITDNASNYESAGEMIVGRYPHIYKTKCAAHGIQLLLKDIYRDVEWIRQIFDEAHKIVNYMYRHIIVLDLMRTYTNNKELKKPCKTRFASRFLMLQSVVEVEDSLRSLVASSDWRNMDYNSSAEALRVMDIIQRSSFWVDSKEVLLVLEPLILVLRLVDGEGSTAGYLYDAMSRAKEALKQRSGNDPVKYLKLWELFEERKNNNILHAVHAAAAFLNPVLMYDGKIKYEQEDIRRGMNYVAENMVTIQERSTFASQMLLYRNRSSNLFNTLSLAMIAEAHPRIWWELNGGDVPILQRVAIRILSQPCSSSPCERNWSAFEAAQTKKRNNLSPEMLESLVYTRMNSLMMEKRADLIMKDSKALNLDKLDELPEDFNNLEENVEVTTTDEDTTWLDAMLGFGS